MERRLLFAVLQRERIFRSLYLIDFSKKKQKTKKQYPRYKGIVTLDIVTCIQVFCITGYLALHSFVRNQCILYNFISILEKTRSNYSVY